MILTLELTDKLGMDIIFMIKRDCFTNKYFKIMIRKILYLATSFLFSLNSFAAINLVCKVQYEKRNGWSDPVKAEITLATGSELNQATGRYSFQNYKIYATVWFSNTECAIIELEENPIGIGSEMEYDDLDRIFLLHSSAEGEQVNTEYKIRWKITAKNYFGYIDERIR